VNGHGGQRVGSGKKPIKHRFPVVDGGASPLSQAPDDLPEEQHAFWNRWAKHATEAGTLNERTEAGFRELCKSEAFSRKLAAVLEEQGYTFITVKTDMDGSTHEDLKVNPLVAKVLVAQKQVYAQMASFMLTAFGKPATGGRVKPQTASKWASVAGA
jgi:phage terminase small subunit